MMLVCALDSLHAILRLRVCLWSPNAVAERIYTCAEFVVWFALKLERVHGCTVNGDCTESQFQTKALLLLNSSTILYASKRQNPNYIHADSITHKRTTISITCICDFFSFWGVWFFSHHLCFCFLQFFETKIEITLTIRKLKLGMSHRHIRNGWVHSLCETYGIEFMDWICQMCTRHMVCEPIIAEWLEHQSMLLQNV